MTHAIELSIVCGDCGGRIALADAPSGDAHAACETCAADLGAWEVVREHARAAMFDALREDCAGLLAPRPPREHAWPAAAPAVLAA